MQRNAMLSKALPAASAAELNGISPIFNQANHGAQFTPARDSRNRRVPGLYLRNGRYYGQLWVDLGRHSFPGRRA